MEDCKQHYSAMYETRIGVAACPWCLIDDLLKEKVVSSLAYSELLDKYNQACVERKELGNQVLDIINDHASDLYDLAERKRRLVSENDVQIHAKITTCETLARKIRQLIEVVYL